MNVLALVRLGSVCGLALVASGCASLVSGRHAEVTLDSNPPAAEVVIRDKHGKHVLTTQTPATVQLKRKDKFIWPAKYTAEFQKPGYQPKKVAINQRVNPWILGNVVFGGVIGLAVDNATGAAWRPKVAAIDAALVPQQYAHQQYPPARGYEQMPMSPACMQGGPPMPQYHQAVQPASGTFYR
jgi:hypothetical protein